MIFDAPELLTLPIGCLRLTYLSIIFLFFSLRLQFWQLPNPVTFDSERSTSMVESSEVSRQPDETSYDADTSTIGQTSLEPSTLGPSMTVDVETSDKQPIRSGPTQESKEETAAAAAAAAIVIAGGSVVPSATEEVATVLSKRKRRASCKCLFLWAASNCSTMTSRLGFQARF